MGQSFVKVALLTAGLLLLVVYGVAPLLLPAPQPASIPADQFSAERAMQYVNTLAQTARRAGTIQMEQAATQVAASLRSCGLDAEVQQSPSAKGTLRNTIARILGAHTGNAILIVSHLDSISYGAGDNASGAAVLLEAACALQAGKTLQNDVILLFEDGEEAGYLGGYAFTARDRSFTTIRVVIGLDTAAWGPVVLLQTTPGNSSLIGAYAASIHNPTAFGFFADADWSISRDTSEIQPFYERGIPGLELEDPTAFAGKHSDADTIDNVRRGSLQQAGDQLLSLVRFLGDQDLPRESKSQLSYFTLWGFGLVHYPAGWNLVLALLSGVGFVVLILRGIRQRLFSVRPLLSAIGLLLVAFIGSAVLGALGSAAFERLFPNPNPNTDSYLIPASLPFFLTVSTLVVAASLFLRRKLEESFGRPALELAGLVPWLLVSVVASIFLATGSSPFVLPWFAAVLASLLEDKLRFVRFIPAAVAAILFAPNILLAYLGTGMQTLALVAPLLVMNAELWRKDGVSRLPPVPTAAGTRARDK